MTTNVTIHSKTLNQVQEYLCRIITGKNHQIDLLLAGVLSGNHILLEDIPGTGKTTLVKALALAIGGKFGRVQFTPDLLPTDIIGASIYNPHDGEFHFKPGPIFNNILLADEINRASPRTQSALLEAMGEQQVTIEGRSIGLSSPFLVIATQNPIDSQGTYPLPEAQLDRFALQFSLGYPSSEEQKKILAGLSGASLLKEAKPIIDLEKLLELQQIAKEIYIEDSLVNYLIALVEASRKHSAVKFGVSPRGAIAMLSVVRAYALIKGRDYVVPDDLKNIAVATMAHRLVLDSKAKYSGTSKEIVVKELLANVGVPR